jgi:WD40 repeat protein
MEVRDPALTATEATATTVLEPSGGDAAFAFDAFASYARDPDERLVVDTKDFLEGLHRVHVKGVRYLAPLRVWVDKVNLAVRRARRDGSAERAALSPDLRSVLDAELVRSRSLIVFCSENATRSTWVNYEVDWWLSSKPPRGPIWLVVTEGADPGRFPEQVFPRAALDAKLHESVWYDFRGYRDRSRRREFARARVHFAADLYGLDQERVAIAVAIAERRRRLVRATAAVLVVAVCVLLGVGYWRARTLEWSLAAASTARSALAREGDAESAVRRALRAQDTWPFAQPAEVVDTLRTALHASRLRARIAPPARGTQPAVASFGARAGASGGALLAVSAGDEVRLVDTATWEDVGGGPLELPAEALAVAFGDDDRRVAAATQDEIVVWQRGRDAWEEVGDPIAEPREKLTTFALSADGSRVAAGSRLGRVKVWSVDDRQPLLEADHVPPGGDGVGTPVLSVDLSRDGHRLLTAGAEGTVVLWREGEGGWRRTTSVGHGRADTKVYRARFAVGDSALVTAGSDRFARTWRIDDDSVVPVASFQHPTEVCDARLGADGEILATMTVDGDVFLWRTDRPEREILQLSSRVGREKGSCSVDLSPDGRWLVAAGEDQVARLWDVDPLVGREIADLPGPVTALAVAPGRSGRGVVAGGEYGDAVVWLGASGRTRSLVGHEGSLRSVALTGDESIAMTAGGDGSVRIWDTRSREQLADLPPMGDVVRAAAMDATGGRIAAVSEDVLRFARLAEGTPRGEPVVSEMPIDGGLAVAFEPDAGALVAVARSGLIFWGREAEASNARPAEVPVSGVRLARFSSNGRSLVTVADEGLQVWRAAGPERLGKPIPAPAGTAVVEVSDDGRFVAAAEGEAVSLSRIGASGDTLRLPAAAQVASLAFHPDGRLLAAGLEDGRIQVWDLPAGAPVAIVPAGDLAELGAIRFTGDGRQLVSASRKGEIRMYPLEAYAPLGWLLSGPELADRRDVREVSLGGATAEKDVQ